MSRAHMVACKHRLAAALLSTTVPVMPQGCCVSQEFQLLGRRVESSLSERLSSFLFFVFGFAILMQQCMSLSDCVNFRGWL